MPPSTMPRRRDRARLGHARTDLRALWHLGAWGGMAVLSLAALAITAQTDIGSERLEIAFGGTAAPADTAHAAAALPPNAPERDAETRALEAQMRSLAADRDRLAARLASLEHHIDDLTGSIERQPAAPAARLAAIPEPAIGAPDSVAPDAGLASMPQAPSAIAIAGAPVSPIVDPLAMPPGTEAAAAGWPGAAPAASTPSATPAAPAAAESTAESVPLPPTRIAALPEAEHAPPAAPAPVRHEYGIELGAAPDIDALRSRWAAVKANYGPLLANLQLVAVRDPRAGATSYRLIAGPLTNYAAARQLCARLAGARAACRPARFDPNSIVQH